ncbi:hypothetical protein SDC9_105340 [bioreactor metagenome]|uniref:Uncharacterized protein n=1 Tax=bioreactor metagenome TaxID=1076179 RepID=A0A645AZC6_9ZZZZ
MRVKLAVGTAVTSIYKDCCEMYDIHTNLTKRIPDAQTVREVRSWTFEASRQCKSITDF